MTKHYRYFIQILSIIPFCFAAWILFGCSSGDITHSNTDDTDVDDTIKGKLTAFSSNEELVAYMKDQYPKSVFSDYSYALTARTSANAGGDPIAAPGSAEGSSYDTPSANDAGNYTGTNLQEAGVDESDAVKTDGDYLYIAGDGKVTVVSATNPMEIISTISVDGSVDSMYLYNTDTDKKLLVLLYAPLNYEGTTWLDSGTTDTASIGIAYWIPVQAKTDVAFYDITNPFSPEEIKTVEAEGYLVSSRRIENRLHIVQQFLPNLPEPYLLENEIPSMNIEDLAPFYSEVTDGVSEGESGQLVAPQNLYHPNIDGGGSIITIMTFDLDNPDLTFTSTGVVADASIVYASTEALYCTSTYWNYSGTSSVEPLEQTIVYKFDLSADQVTPRDYISVNGRALNQFSLGEYEGVLRIATTTGWAWGTEATSKNHLYCIKFQNNQLEIIGRLEDIAPGEQLYSARFIGPTGYLVTFVTIDPLFTLDLSDPTAPKVVGELKVPGYSTYIHQWGDNHIVTIGKDAIEEGGFAWYQGLQLSIFDISNLSSPQLVNKVVIGDRGTDSEALYNHKAFTFWEANGLLALPIDLYELQSAQTSPSDYGELTFKGLYVYRVTIENGFEPIGRISTLSDLDQYWYYYGWTRGVFIDEDIYAVTPKVVKSAAVGDIEGTVQSLNIE